jgi:hypothetical protein
VNVRSPTRIPGATSVVRLVIAAAATCLVSLGTVLAVPGTAAAVVPVWPAASAFNAVPGDANTVSGEELVTLNSVACASQGNCVAVGAYADTGSRFLDQALVTTETNGVWGPEPGELRRRRLV